jgi:hypothetical protein
VGPDSRSPWREPSQESFVRDSPLFLYVKIQFLSPHVPHPMDRTSQPGSSHSRRIQKPELRSVWHGTPMESTGYIDSTRLSGHTAALNLLGLGEIRFRRTPGAVPGYPMLKRYNLQSTSNQPVHGDQCRDWNVLKRKANCTQPHHSKCATSSPRFTVIRHERVHEAAGEATIVNSSGAGER